MDFSREQTEAFPNGLPLVRGKRETAQFLKEVRQTDKRIVFVNGCFDLIHPGHLQVFFEARALGEILVVAMNSDASIERLKGPSRPILKESVRLTMVGALKPVDAVFCFDEPDASNAIDFVVPHIYAKGAQYRDKPYPECQIVEKLGVEVKYLNHVDGFSTSLLVEHIAAGRGKFG